MSSVTLQGIQFFNHPSSCISHFEKAHWTKKALSLIQSFGTLFIYFMNKISLLWHKVEAQVTPHTKLPANLSKQTLVVCIHGLNNNPTQFKQTLDEMQKYDLSETAIYLPYVLQKGHAKLDDMAMPIFEEIKKWAQTSGEKKLVLVGISNGGRIARAIAAKLPELEHIKQLRFVSIVGACQGSSLVNLAHKLHLSWLLSKNISEEMAINSERNIQLNQDWKNALESSPEIQRDYTFIASPHDWQVPNYNSTLMEVKGSTKYTIIPNHGHNSIVNTVAKAVAEIICA